MMTDTHAINRFVALGRSALKLSGGLAGTVVPEDLKLFHKRVVSRPDAFLRELDGKLDAGKRELSPAKQRQLAVLEGTVDLFGPMDQIREETLHTRVLAWALSPKRLRSGLGTSPLRAFLRLLGRSAEGVVPDSGSQLVDVLAIPERSVGKNGRVDIWIELKNAVLAVEVKVDSCEHDEQTCRYRLAVGRACGGTQRVGHVVFLTMPGAEPPSDQASICVDFRELVRAWLPVAANGDSEHHRYLGWYLRTVTQQLLGISATGLFADWPQGRRARTLALLAGAAS